MLYFEGMPMGKMQQVRKELVSFCPLNALAYFLLRVNSNNYCILIGIGKIVLLFLKKIHTYCIVELILTN